MERSSMTKKASKRIKTISGNPAFNVGPGANRTYADPVRVGIVGLGRIGLGHHAKIVMGHNAYRLTAVCDIRPDRLGEAMQVSGATGYARYTEMLKNTDVELILVCTLSRDHERMTVQALKAGKHVMCEKPAVRTPEGIDRMVAAARKARRVVTFHHNHRFTDEALLVKEIVQSGKLGRVFRVRRRVAGFNRRNDWQVLRKYGGGMTGNWGVHLVDQCLQLADSPVKSVWGHVEHLFNPGDAEDDIKAVFETEQGMVADIDMTSVDASEQPSWVVLGSCGSLWIQDGKAHMKYYNPRRLKQVTVNDMPYAPGMAFGIYPGEDRIPWIEKVMDVKPRKVVSFYRNLYEAIRHNEALLITPESARRTYDVLARIRRGSGF
jgi:scyllo-inositol 2-dehydrogenase (NADP+)